MALKKGDFISVEFTGKIKNGGIFDSNVEKDLKIINPKFTKEQIQPYIFCLGESMFLKGVEDFLIGKEIGDYNIELEAKDAFGKRDTQLIQRIPLKIFHDQKINPIPGSTFNFDGKIGKVLASSGGRVLVDFNGPLAGKDVSYHVKVLSIIEKIEDKVDALNEFLFRRKLKYEIKEKRLILRLDKQMSPFAILFKDKYKEMLDLDLEVQEIEEKREKSPGKKSKTEKK